MSSNSISYGCQACNTFLIALTFPCFWGLLPTQSYNQFTFNDSEQKLEKWYKGFGICCCSSQLQFSINYSEIESMSHQMSGEMVDTQYGPQQCEVDKLTINLKNKEKKEIYIPENACYRSEGQSCHCCCRNKFCYNGFNCCRDQYTMICKQIIEEWSRRNDSSSKKKITENTSNQLRRMDIP